MSLLLDGTNGVSDVDGTAATPAIRGTDANTGISFGTDTVTISTGGVARVTTDASGNVGIGVTPSAWSSLYRVLQTPAGVSLAGRTDGAIEGITTANAYRDSGGTWRYVQSGVARRYNQDPDGHLWFTAPTGTAGDAITFTERARIDASGNLLVGTTSTAISNTNGFVFNAGSALNIYRTSGASQFMIGFGNGVNIVGSVSTSTTSTTYNTSSDYRLKENVAPMTGALAKVQQLKPVTYTWKTDGSAGQGFIAHELQAVVPDCVTGEKDAVEIVDDLDDEGKKIGTKEVPRYQGVDSSFLVATIVAALQEQQAIITQQQATISAMETRLAALEA